MRVYTSDLYLMRGAGGRVLFDEDALVRGSGIGSIFKSVFSSVMPFVKKALGVGTRALKSDVGRAVTKELKRTATQAGLDVVGDALQGKNVLQSSKIALSKAQNRMGRKLQEIAQTQTGRTPAKKTKKPRPIGKRTGRALSLAKGGRGGKKNKKKKKGGTKKKGGKTKGKKKGKTKGKKNKKGGKKSGKKKGGGGKKKKGGSGKKRPKNVYLNSLFS
jgi:hypothetical protein